MVRRLLLGTFLAVGLVACKPAPDEKAVAEPVSSPETSESTEEPAAAPQPGEALQPLVIHDDQAEHRDSPNKKGHIVRLVTGKNAFLGKLSMEPGGEVPVHRDPTEEFIYVLEGSGVMTIDGKDYDVVPNTAIYMPPDAEVSFKNGAEKLVAIQVFAGPEPAAKYDKWIGADVRE